MQSSADLEIHDGIQAGNQIVKAIEAYHQAESRYPLTLDDLVPTYLSVIPLKGAGQGFYYRWFGNTGPMAAEVYWLAFKVASQDHLVCTYYRRLAYWDCNYESP